MKRSITLGELIMAGFIVLGAVLAFWINTNVRLSLLEKNGDIFQQNNAEMKVDMRQGFRELGAKVDQLSQGQNEIKIALQNKQDRK